MTINCSSSTNYAEKVKKYKVPYIAKIFKLSVQLQACVQ